MSRLGNDGEGVKQGIMKRAYDSKLPRELFLYYVGLWTTITSRFPVGTNVFEREWDVLILLDTCRVDALREVQPEYEFIDEVDSVLSVGSTSNEWIANTFIKSYLKTIKQTGYVSSNAYTERVLEKGIYPEVHMDGKRSPPCWNTPPTIGADELLFVDQPWRYAPDDSPGHILPRYITDRAIAVSREYNWERLIIHYSQPHAPYIASAVAEDRDLKSFEDSPFAALRRGESFDLIWNAYIDNLRMVLDDISTLLNNLDADTVIISSDHGDAFGEWGMYGHLPGMLSPHVKRVPWAPTSGRDVGGYQPTLEPTPQDSKDVEEHLQALGYK